MKPFDYYDKPQTLYPNKKDYITFCAPRCVRIGGTTDLGLLLQMTELLKTPVKYVVDIQNKKISLHQEEDFEVLSFNTVDEFMYALTDIRKTNNIIWYVIPPGLIDPPIKVN